VDTDPAMMRPTDLRISRADPSRAAAQLDWQAQTRMQGVIRKMLEAARN
jgi:GDPmannose 4,6-dehydratase